MKRSRVYSIGMVIVSLCILSVLIQYAFSRPNFITGSLVRPTSALTSCSASANDFFGLQYTSISKDNDVLDQWSTNFHELIDQLVTAQMNDEEFAIDCAAPEIGGFIQPTSAMQTVLTQWEPFTLDPDTAKLSRLDIGYVLVELLRQYECALQERYYFLYSDVSRELVTEKLNLGIFSPSDQGYVNIQEVSAEATEQQDKIIRELRVSRAAVEQVVRILNGRERTSVIRAEVECLERASLDIRNATGLAAEANSCLPRIWNSKDSLFDPTQ